MSIAIIGGADGPTAIYVSSDISWYVIISLIIIGSAVIGTILWNIRKKER